jgi:mannitol-specific phosphotransferase system IIBC component
MEEEILNHINYLISGFKLKDYSRLARVLNDKLNRYLHKKNNENWDNEVLLKNVKQLMTNIMETIYLHIEAGIGAAQTQIEMIDSSLELFKELDITSENIKIKNIYKNIESIKTIKDQYLEFQEVRVSLVTLIKSFNENNYLLESNKLAGVIK